MARNQLTVTRIKGSTAERLGDGDGLWLRRNRSGNRSWVFIYIRDGRRREMGLGTYGSGTGMVGLADARIKADEVRAILGRGGDPFMEMEERKGRGGATFGEVADAYVVSMSSRWRGAKTVAGWKRSVEVHAKPIRDLRIDKVDTDAVVRCLQLIWGEKPESATKLRERIKMVLDHARARGLRSGENPAEWKGHLDQILPAPQALKRGHHAAMAYSDVPAFIAKIRAARGMAARGLEFAILTATRSGEARGATWEEIDLDRKIWTIPANRMKAGKLLRVPLSPRAIEIVQDVQKQSKSEYIFPSTKGRTPLSDMAFGKVLKTYGGEKFTTHGFRSSFRDWVTEATTFQRELAEAALAHAVGDAVERAYARSDAMEKRRVMMDAWADFCERAG